MECPSCKSFEKQIIQVMEYNLIDGKATATAIKKEIAEEVKKIVASGDKKPHLAAILVGHDGGSETYVIKCYLASNAGSNPHLFVSKRM